MFFGNPCDRIQFSAALITREGIRTPLILISKKKSEIRVFHFSFKEPWLSLFRGPGLPGLWIAE